jgi:hypothetical protein
MKSSDRLTMRNGKLYNLSSQTYTFTSDIDLNQIIILDWTDLPEVARRYITVRAARIFTDRYLPNQVTHMFTLQDEQRARGQLEQREGDEADYTVFDNNYSRQITWRGYGPLDRFPY